MLYFEEEKDKLRKENDVMRERLDELIMIIEKAGNPTSFDYPSSLIPTIIKRSKNLQEVPKMGALRKKYNQQIIQEATVEKDQEITRLKELLGRVHQNIKLDLMYIPGEKNRHQNILIEIDNALNHKP